MRGEILGAERRRRWSDEEKLAIVRSVGVGGATVTQIAQRHDVTRQQIYRWRHDLKSKGHASPKRCFCRSSFWKWTRKQRSLAQLALNKMGELRLFCAMAGVCELMHISMRLL